MKIRLHLWIRDTHFSSPSPQFNGEEKNPTLSGSLINAYISANRIAATQPYFFADEIQSFIVLPL